MHPGLSAGDAETGGQGVQDHVLPQNRRILHHQRRNGGKVLPRRKASSLDSAQQIAKALGQKVETLFEVETDERPVTPETMREYVLFIRAVINYANENYNVDAKPPQIRACGKRERAWTACIKTRWSACSKR